MMCCATGLPVPDWVRGMCAPVPRSSTHTTGVLLVLNQRRTRQWSQTDESRNAFVGFPKYTSECYNTVSLQSVTTRESFSPGASRGPPSRHSSHRSPSCLEPGLFLPCAWEIGISTTPEASLPDRLQSVPSTLFTSRPSERPSAALARASFRLSQLSFSRSPRAKKGAIARRAVPGLLSVPGPICWSHWAML